MHYPIISIQVSITTSVIKITEFKMREIFVKIIMVDNALFNLILLLM